MTFCTNLFDDFCSHIKRWGQRGVLSDKLTISGVCNKTEETVSSWIREHGVSAGFDRFSQIPSSRPRKINLSPSFSCPECVRPSFEQLKLHIEDGDDLCPYLGNNVRKLGKHDSMLADWGIWHFHLVPRELRATVNDDYLLFAWLSGGAAYLITIGTHRDIANTEYLKDLQRNYPVALGSEINVMGVDIDSDEYKKLRAARVNAAIAINGHVYYCPGGGRNADGGSTLGHRNAMIVRRRLDRASQILADGLSDAIKRLMPEERYRSLEDASLDLKLEWFDDREIRVVCPVLGVGFSLLDKEMKIALVEGVE